MDLHVEVASDGDGWLAVDTDDWLTEQLGEPDDDLTSDLHQWAEANDASPADCDAARRWALQRFGTVEGPEPGDDPVTFNSANTDTLLSDDICVTILRVCDDGTHLTLTVVGHRDVYVLGPNQEWTDPIDWSRATGRCPNHHAFTVESACYLHSDHDSSSHRVAEQSCAHDTGGG